MGARLAFWVLPDAESAAWLTERIQTLAAEHGTTPFEAHLTVLCGNLRTEDGGLRLPDGAPFSLTARRVRDSARYTRTLFVELEPSPELLDLRARLAESFAEVDEGPFVPHLSLIYGGLTPAQRRHLAATLRPPAAPFRFVELAAVAVPRSVKAPEDVLAFRVLERRILR